MKVKVSGSFRVVGDDGWGVNFGPLSDVDALIPESDGMTLRDLREAGQIPADCFDDTDQEAEDN
jgi:hypothetical protein